MMTNVPECLKSANGQFMVCAAHRYAMGRMTSAPYIVCSWIRAYWGYLTEDTQSSITEETLVELARNPIEDRHSLGMQCDVDGWREFAEWAYAQLEHHRQEQIYQRFIAYNRSWPIGKLPPSLKDEDK